MTGAGPGLGRAVAVRLARDGARQLLVDIDPANAENAAEEVGGQGAQAQALTADVTDDRGCERVVEAAGDGRIVNFGSELSENPRPERVVYAASKGAVRSLTKAWVTGHTVAADGGWTMW